MRAERETDKHTDSSTHIQTRTSQYSTPHRGEGGRERCKVTGYNSSKHPSPPQELVCRMESQRNLPPAADVKFPRLYRSQSKLVLDLTTPEGWKAVRVDLVGLVTYRASRCTLGILRHRIANFHPLKDGHPSHY